MHTVDGQHRAARARQLRKDRGPVSQRRGGGPRAAGGRQGGRADSPVRVGDVRGVAAGPREHREGVLALTLGASAVVGPAREVQQAGGTETVGGRRRREVAHASPTAEGGAGVSKLRRRHLVAWAAAAVAAAVAALVSRLLLLLSCSCSRGPC